MTAFAPANAQGAFVRQFSNYFVDDEQLRNILMARDTELALAMNLRDIAIYDEVEVLNGQQFFNPAATQNQKKRFAFRKVFQIPATAAGGNYTVNHNISNVTIFTRIYGTVITDFVDFRPIPYASVGAITDQISIRATATQLIIDVGATSPNVTSGIAVLEYLKN